MIYHAISEANPQSKLPDNVIEYGKKFDALEEHTGADFVIVPEKSNYEKVQELLEQGLNYSQIVDKMKLSISDAVELAKYDSELRLTVTAKKKSYSDIAKEKSLTLAQVASLANRNMDSVLFEWLYAGAVLVQRKSGYDFLQSIGPRVNDSIAKMVDVTQNYWQRIILITGIFSEKDDFVELDGRKTNWTWVSYLGCLNRIWQRGALTFFLPRDDLILQWIQSTEQQFLDCKRDGKKWVVSPVYYPPDKPDLNDPLQLLQPVRDARLSLVNVPGWGTTKINTLHAHVKKSLNLLHREPNLFELLQYATSEETAQYCKGIGSTLIANAREYVGLQENEYLWKHNNNVTVQTKGE
jgi:hypothetical protein